MNIFLLWKWAPNATAKRTASEVGDRLQELYAPLFDATTHLEIRSFAVAQLATLQLPVNGFRPASQGEDSERWAYAPQFPVNALDVVPARGVNDDLLPGLCRAIEENARPVLRALAPPFSLIWHNTR
jgi:hypothetical protein